VEFLVDEARQQLNITFSQVALEIQRHSCSRDVRRAQRCR